MDSMDTSDSLNVSNPHVHPQQLITSSQNKDGFNKMESEEKMTAVHQEMHRMNKLPPNSTYATHRLRVLNKIMHLLSLKIHIPRRGVGIAFCRSLSLKELQIIQITCVCRNGELMVSASYKVDNNLSTESTGQGSCRIM